MSEAAVDATAGAAPPGAAVPDPVPPAAFAVAGRCLGAVGLLGRLARLQDVVTAAVQRRRLDDPAPDDPYRGLYLSDDVVDCLLATAPGGVGPAGVDDSRLSALAADFGLSDLDVELLLVALAPEVDSRFERFYGYLNDDVGRRRASIGLALELGGASPADPAARSRLAPGTPLTGGGLVAVEEAERPFLTRSLRVPDRVVAHLLGDDRPDAAVRDLLSVGVARPATDATTLAAALLAGLRLAYLAEPADGRALAIAAVAAAGRLPLVLDLGRLAALPDPVGAVRAVGWEVRLRRAGLVAGPVCGLPDDSVVVGSLARLAGPVLLFG